MFQKIYNNYKALYDLPVIQRTDNDDHAFTRPGIFKELLVLVFVIYNENDEILIINDLSSYRGWELPGGFIHTEEKKIEPLEFAISRIVARETGLIVDQVEPLCFIMNGFEDDNMYALHRGVAFTARTRGSIKPESVSIRGAFVKAVDEFDLPPVNKKIVDLASKKIAKSPHSIPIPEIDANAKHVLRYRLHKIFIQPLVNYLSSRVLRKRIIELCQDKSGSVLDVSCGEDDLILALPQDTKVGNDISWKMIEVLRKRKPKAKITYTNHNALNLPFTYDFDIVLCKNTLHHTKDLVEMQRLLEELGRIGKKLIIVDVEDPKRSTKTALVWNFYYRTFLGDVGNNFLSFKEFKHVISSCFESTGIQFDRVHTIKGVYMFAVIHNK